MSNEPEQYLTHKATMLFIWTTCRTLLQGWLACSDDVDVQNKSSSQLQKILMG